MLHSRNSNLCPELMSTNDIPGTKASTTSWAKRQHYILAELLQNLYSNYWTIYPPQSVTNFVVVRIQVFFWMIHILICGRPTTLLYIADSREYFTGPIEGYYCTIIQVLILSQLLVVSSNTCSTFKYFAVSACRLLQVLLLYPLNYRLNCTCWVNAFDPQ